MGYTTDFEGAFKVEARRLAFNLRFTLPSRNDLSLLELSNSDLFAHIVFLAFYNDNPSVLHHLRTISKTFYFLCSSIKQENVFTKVSKPVSSMLYGLSHTRRMLRCRFINSIDYGMDGQYYFDSNDFHNYGQSDRKYKTFYQGKPLGYNRCGRTQPSLWLQWQFDEKTQTIAWDGQEKFYHYIEWLIYIINNLLHSNGYIIFGKVEWEGEYCGDKGMIIIENDGLNNVIIKNTDNNNDNKENPRRSDETTRKLEDLSKLKKKNIIWKNIWKSSLKMENFFDDKQRSKKMLEMKSKYFQLINDKNFIENNKVIQDERDLMKKIAMDMNDVNESDLTMFGSLLSLL